MPSVAALRPALPAVLDALVAAWAPLGGPGGPPEAHEQGLWVPGRGFGFWRHESAQEAFEALQAAGLLPPEAAEARPVAGALTVLSVAGWSLARGVLQGRVRLPARVIDRARRPLPSHVLLAMGAAIGPILSFFVLACLRVIARGPTDRPSERSGGSGPPGASTGHGRADPVTREPAEEAPWCPTARTLYAGLAMSDPSRLADPDAPVRLPDRIRAPERMVAEAQARGASARRLGWATAAVAAFLVARLDRARLLADDRPERALEALRDWCRGAGQARDLREAVAEVADACREAVAGPRAALGLLAVREMVADAWLQAEIHQGQGPGTDLADAFLTGASALTALGEGPAEAARAQLAEVYARALAAPMVERRANPSRGRSPLREDLRQRQSEVLRALRVQSGDDGVGWLRLEIPDGAEGTSQISVYYGDPVELAGRLEEMERFAVARAIRRGSGRVAYLADFYLDPSIRGGSFPLECWGLMERELSSRGVGTVWTHFGPEEDVDPRSLRYFIMRLGFRPVPGLSDGGMPAYRLAVPGRRPNPSRDPSPLRPLEGEPDMYRWDDQIHGVTGVVGWSEATQAAMIYEWTSWRPGLGATSRSLERLRALAPKGIFVLDPGEVGTDSRAYWEHQFDRGRVDALLDEYARVLRQRRSRPFSTDPEALARAENPPARAPRRTRAARAPSSGPIDPLAPLRWAARWLHEDDEDWFVGGCGDIAVLLEAFARTIALPGVRAVGGLAGNTPRGLYPHAWLEVEGARYDPRADVEKLRIGIYEPTEEGLGLVVCEWPGGDESDGGMAADARLHSLLGAYRAHLARTGPRASRS